MANDLAQAMAGISAFGQETLSSRFSCQSIKAIMPVSEELLV